MQPCPHDDWLNEFRDDACLFVENRLPHPVLKPFRESLASSGVARAEVIANYLRRFDDYFCHKYDFARWYKLVSYREALRVIIEVESVEAPLSAMPAEPKSLMRWSYVDQLTANEVARLLRLTVLQRAKFNTAAAQEKVVDAYRELCRRLLARHRSSDTEAAGRFADCSWVFPTPPALSGDFTVLVDGGP